MPTENFRSDDAYFKSRAYTHIHGIPTHAKRVCIKGKCHKVHHSDKKLGQRKTKVRARTHRKRAGKRV